MAVQKIQSLNKHENPATNENEFDIENYLNENWDKIQEVVNNNADELTTAHGNISDLDDNKVDKEEGKGLSTEDYTTKEKTKLAGLSNYDDTEVKQNIESLEAENETLRDQIPTGEASGESILLTDSANLKCKKFEIKGKSWQETREGYNLLNVPKEFTVSNGFERIAGEYEIGTYTVKVGEITTDNDNATKFLVSFEDEEGAVFLTKYLTKTNTTLTATLEKKAVYVRIYSSDGWNSSVETITDFKELMIYKGTDDKEYEEYGATPSPNIPSTIRNSGEDGSINSRVANSNLTNTDILASLNNPAITINSKNSFSIDLSKRRDSKFYN